MNTSYLKTYAPKARRDFIDAVTQRANLFGIRKNMIAEAKITGGLMDIEGKTFEASLMRSRERLAKRVEAVGFDQLMELLAYTWFNRLCAIRYMELHGYLDHGLRVLSSPTTPNGFEILEHAQDVADDLGLSRERVVELKLAGNKDEELFRELLVGQCHKLHQAMPFLFEALDDETELLLPDNLTRTDSLIRALVDDIPEADWANIEIIGWLYQFYISEKKDQVIGKVVKSEDIPAATQLFTPNWIVKYLVQNSVGRQWLMTYPDSSLKAEMEYYIEPPEQTDAVNAQLAEITPDNIDPEAIKVLDPACGSGHILVEAYNVLKAIYEERGYRSRDIPKLILEHNLFGLDIDDRAAQLAGFSLMMKAREDDRRIFTRDVKLNVLSLQESQHVDLPVLWKALNLSGDWNRGTSDNLFDNAQQDLSSYAADNRFRLLQNVVRRFEEAKTFGSLIDVPSELFEPLTALHETLVQLEKTGDSMQKPAAETLLPLVQQAWVLSHRFSAVVANPPYMGSGGMNSDLKKFAKDHYPNSKSDLFSIYIERCFSLGKRKSQIALVTPYVWMFLSSFTKLRENILSSHSLKSLIQLEYNAFAPACIPVCAYSFSHSHTSDFVGSFIRLSDFKGSENQAPRTLEAINNKSCSWFHLATPDRFKNIPGSPVAYWENKDITAIFEKERNISSKGYAGFGIKTGNNEIFMRQWFEVSIENSSILDSGASEPRWYPCASGGKFRKWYGNRNLVVNYRNQGEEIKSYAEENGNSYGFNASKYYFKKSITWPKLTSSLNSFRSTPPDSVFDGVGLSAFFDSDDDYMKALAALNTKLYQKLINMVAPTLSLTSGDLLKLPFPDSVSINHSSIDELISISKWDWNLYEVSFDFLGSPLIGSSRVLIQNSYDEFTELRSSKINRTKELEEENSSSFIKGYNLEGTISPATPLKEITLTTNPRYRYGGDASNEGMEDRFQSDSLCELINYSIGCMMGRYSLSRDGLVYAHAGNEGFTDLVNEGAYNTFPVDDDGIIPLTDQEWFADDATNRFREFIRVACNDEHLQENLDFVAESLCLYAIKPKRGESSLETVRRYLSTQFYKDHLQTYKKRPIYWLFSSGKQKAFECLVYLHRYNEGTLARMRTEYVTPLTGKYAVHAEQLEQQIEGADSTAEANRLKKELTALEKQLVELREFDAKLKHFADRRISLDLDDGVKQNYGKFGDLLAEVKTITGEAPEKI